MTQLIKKATTFLSMGLLVVFAFGFHLSVLPSSSSYAMEGAHHSSSPSTSCTTVCNFAAVRKDEYLREHENNKDDEPEAYFYAQSRSHSLLALEKQHNQEARAVMERDLPPGGLPAYIALTVFRT